MWGPKPKKLQVPSSKISNPFKIIFTHLVSKRGSQDVKTRSWMPKDGGFGKRRLGKGQKMLRIKLGAWSRVSK